MEHRREDDAMQEATQSEMIRDTHRIIKRLEYDYYGNGKMGDKTKIDRLWVGARLLAWMLGAVGTAIVTVKVKNLP